jgi:nitroimidazol reductase NimA-like FMN-containing flavoprotein (pyridoxamine 5'-phosphate oxidase superfamily)
MPNDNMDVLAKDIISHNTYLTLGTSSDNISWSSPVHYAVSDKYEFYFISQMKSIHAQNIIKNPQVSFAIFDSHQEVGKGTGVQASGKAKMLVEGDMVEALVWYKPGYLNNKIGAFLGSSPYRFFKIIPEHIYIADPNSDIDRRIEVNLK